MQPVPSTSAILASHVLGKPYHHLLVQWALDMMDAGYDSEHLVELAGQKEPFNWFEIKILVDKVFAELSLDYSNREVVIQRYACYLADQVAHEKLGVATVLAIFRGLYLDLDYPTYLHDFYLLYFAHEDLQRDSVQWYWEGATRENIADIITGYFTEWQWKYCKQG